jgi:hypothetical protein
MGEGGMGLKIRAWALRGCESDLESKQLPKGGEVCLYVFVWPHLAPFIRKSHYHGSSPWAKKIFLKNALPPRKLPAIYSGGFYLCRVFA